MARTCAGLRGRDIWGTDKKTARTYTNKPETINKI